MDTQLPNKPPNPSLYQINTRVMLNELSNTLRKPATLSDISDAFLDTLKARCFDYVWFLGVWQTGTAAKVQLTKKVRKVEQQANA